MCGSEYRKKLRGRCSKFRTSCKKNDFTPHACVFRGRYHLRGLSSGFRRPQDGRVGFARLRGFHVSGKGCPVPGELGCHVKVIADVNQQYPVRSASAARATTAGSAAEGRNSVQLEDAVELSPAAQRELSGSNEPRTDLVQRIRSEIRDGSYMTEEKLNATVNRLFKALRPG